MEHKYLEKTARVVDTLIKQLAAAKKALEWYADDDRYFGHDPEAIHVRGQVARDVLVEIERIEHE